MIRKLKSGQYRLYSRKINPKTGRRWAGAAISGPSRRARQPGSTSAPCSFSNAAADEAARNGVQPIAGSSGLKYPPPDGSPDCVWQDKQMETQFARVMAQAQHGRFSVHD